MNWGPRDLNSSPTWKLYFNLWTVASRMLHICTYILSQWFIQSCMYLHTKFIATFVVTF